MTSSRVRACDEAAGVRGGLTADVTLKRWLLSAQRSLSPEGAGASARVPAGLLRPDQAGRGVRPGAPLTSQAAIERVIAPAKPVRAIAG